MELSNYRVIVFCSEKFGEVTWLSTVASKFVGLICLTISSRTLGVYLIHDDSIYYELTSCLSNGDYSFSPQRVIRYLMKLDTGEL